MNFIEDFKRRASIYKIRFFDLFSDVRSPLDFWIAISTIFNHFNLRLKKATGFFFPFSLGMPVDDLKYPISVDILKSLERRFKPVLVRGEDKDFHLNVMLPTINPELIFGGYISLFNFVESLLENGQKVRLMICEDVLPSVEFVSKKMGNESVVTRVIKRCELVMCIDRNNIYKVGKNDVFVGYSWMTMRLAHHAANMLNQKLPIYFIQEYEPIFYNYDSLRFLADETYQFPHNAIFNSPQLMKFFQQKKLGVFSGEPTGNYCFFKHAIADIPAPSMNELRRKDKKKLLVYARPERHAGRNMFEVSLIALKEAVRRGFLDTDEWDFYGIGSLGASDKMDIGGGSVLQLLPRLPYSQYTQSLKNYDIGMSLMYAPHPSVPPFEMASAGMLTITTDFENRDSEAMQSVSKNIIVATHSISSIVMSIKEAIERLDDVESRSKNAKIDWSRSWKESFGKEFMSNFLSMIGAK